MTSTTFEEEVTMAGDPTPQNTVKIALQPLTKGSIPANVHDDSFVKALTAAKAGGDATQHYFDAVNDTADYWNWLTQVLSEGEEPWAAGQSQGYPIQMSSDGNLMVRMGTFYRGPANGAEGHVFKEGDQPPVVGIATLQTHNTTTAASSTASFVLSLAGLPPGIVISKDLFKDLLTPVYGNMKILFNKLATKFKALASVDGPRITGDQDADGPIREAEDDVEPITGDLGQQGAEFLAVDWGEAVLEVGGLGVLAAIPLIVSFIGHKMVASLMINNTTETDFSWSIKEQVFGKASVLPAQDANNQTIPKMDYTVDDWGDKSTTKVSYEARMQFINDSDLGDIGFVLGLKPADGGPEIATVVRIPFEGANAIWTGKFTPGQSNRDLYFEHGTSSGKLNAEATVGAYTSTISINKLTGKTDDAYFYGVLVVIE
jgi:hypothetical protein